LFLSVLFPLHFVNNIHGNPVLNSKQEWKATTSFSIITMLHGVSQSISWLVNYFFS